MMRCIQCDTELVAPVRSEYWSDKHACHIWLCPKCYACFSSVVSFPNFQQKPSRWGHEAFAIHTSTCRSTMTGSVNANVEP